ncbi:glycoside hydrolase family 3 protein [Pseudooceanicola sp. CBS1P-1]|uniref:beta-N-acetylhexosaminidase n=1 Tax=Pseudooceanicola albus TaxID=2692189 RepID=A0A6L7G2P6_9RHOB|nr:MULTISPECIES: glycoside hydrolase family 3 N-terminal domain-containing protein [Pseudooceanicola]MBT9382311.1 glycoside hydrolase family 3 protein [Pseudooceanicola endophyticus]MXN16853.1 glycoside hydrolase family 3 protein [Pseudooceanicola albus]
MQPEDLMRAPFHLDQEALDWVVATWDGLDPLQQAAQLFTLNSRGPVDAAERARLAALQPGGITRFFGTDGEAERSALDALQEDAAIPMLVSADLEGSRMSLPFGTPVPNPLALAAADDEALTREVSRIMAAEARAIGVNWSFTPVLDINAAPRSAIVATRGYGSDPAKIARHALAQLTEFEAAGLAATVKHWPGEGYDDRDQHLVTTINPLSMEDWHASFGKLYGDAIRAGARAVMSAHIALPAYRPDAPDAERYLPATISRALNEDLLRGELGFNGIIVSDASEMAGLTSVLAPLEAKIEILRAGCDMVLFSSDPETEIAAVRDAVASGRIPAERFRAAGLRVLGLKASLGLHRSRKAPETPAPEGRATITERAFAAAPTLVKDRDATLPLDPARHRRILVLSPGIVEPMGNEQIPFALPQMLREAGFEVTEAPYGTPLDITGQDLVLYLFGEETLLTRSRIFLDWRALHGHFKTAMARPWTALPTVMISFGYPYYLYDAPRVPTYINAYSTHEAMQRAVCEALLGRAPFAGTNPVDPFAGAPDARL